jgi:tetratricopeptide (TPR) repeat protein
MAALQHLRAGRLQQAGELCEQVLRQDPNCTEALHLLGVIAGQAGFLEPAVQFLKRSIQLRPMVARYWNDLGVTHRKLNQMDLADECFEEAPITTWATSTRSAASGIWGRNTIGVPFNCGLPTPMHGMVQAGAYSH